MEKWHAYISSSVDGPFTTEEILKLISETKIYSDTLLLQEGAKDWQAAKTFSQFKDIVKEPDKENIQYTTEAQAGSAAYSLGQPAQSPSNTSAADNQTQEKNSTGTNEQVSQPPKKNTTSVSVQPVKSPVNFEKKLSDIIEEDSLCPVCGYFVGSLLTCPRCGSRPQNQISIKVIKYTAVIGSIIGIIFLWFAAAAKQPAKIKIADVNEPMNGAYVMIEGKIVDYREDAAKDTLKIKVDDGTGLPIGINAFKKLKDLKKIFNNNMPGVGDEVEVTGVLNITDKFGVSMFLQIPERLVIKNRFEVKKMNIGDLNKDNVDEIVKVKVHVSKINERETKKGGKMYMMTLKDNTGSISMTMFEGNYEKLSDDVKKIFSDKAEFETLIKVGEYKGKLQAGIFDPSKIVKTGEGGTDSRNESSEEEAGADDENKRNGDNSSESKSSDSGSSVKSIGDIKDEDLKSIVKISAEVKKSKKTVKELMLLLTMVLVPLML